MTNLFGEPPETLLPEDPGADSLAAGDDHESAADADRAHRGQDTDGGVSTGTRGRIGGRRLTIAGHGIVGHGPLPWSHEPNRPFLRALAALADASERFGDAGEAQRCREFMHESSKEAYEELVVPKS